MDEEKINKISKIFTNIILAIFLYSFLIFFIYLFYKGIISRELNKETIFFINENQIIINIFIYIIVYIITHNLTKNIKLDEVNQNEIEKENKIENEIKKEKIIEDKESEEYKKYLIKKDYIMTLTEKVFFNKLNDFINKEKYFIFTKVRLADIVNIKRTYDFGAKIVFNKIKSKHIDFVITDTKGKILKCIELDDYSHNKEKKGDLVKDKVLNIMGVELVRIKVAYNYDLSILNLENKIITSKITDL